MKKDYTDITMLLDRSGSMSTLWSDVEGGITNFIEKNKKLDGEVKFTLLVFDELNGVNVDTVLDSVDIKQLSKIDLSQYKPRGNTPLNDAMGGSINKLGSKFSSMKEEERPDKVLFVTYTDGMENASREFNSSNVKKLVQHQSDKYNWEFVYLGTNQNVHAVADALGISSGNRTFYACNAVGVADSMAKCSSGSLKFRGKNYTKGTYFIDDEKDNNG